MKKLKNGSFSATLDLETGKEYAYKFLIDGQTWENDWDAEKYAPAGIGAEENSVVIL